MLCQLPSVKSLRAIHTACIRVHPRGHEYLHRYTHVSVVIILIENDDVHATRISTCVYTAALHTHWGINVYLFTARVSLLSAVITSFMLVFYQQH